MNIILLGPPGAGKGTQAAKIVEKFHVVHISTGDIFRKNISENTPLGQKVKQYTEKGLLVPDEITVAMVKDRLSQPDCKAGYMLDGFPRTIPQAESLEVMGEKVDCALNIDCDYALLIDRISGRRMCKECGASYHIKNSPSKEEGKCDKCGGELYQRDDDNEQTVKARLAEYDEKTLPLTEFYKAKGLLLQVDGNGSIEQTTENVYKALTSFI
ncbi:MAG: adenylate kinase [Eubacteriaceae bacterium]|nr:adenylate kinase [Eubacteriaceae bacterium]